MVAIVEIFLLPPLAIGRLGAGKTPLENFTWREDPTVHGAARNVIEPAPTLEVLPDGSITPYLPGVIRFRDGDDLRPVAPFFEVWANVQADSGGVHPEPLTAKLLRALGSSLDAVSFSIRLANRKASRRTGNEADAFEAYLEVPAIDHRRHALLAFTPPEAGAAPLVLPERPIPLGHFQVIRPAARTSAGINLDVVRVRVTPAAGLSYGPPAAVRGRAPSSGRVYEIVRPENRILNPQASWMRYNADYSTYNNPEPFDTYDGADEGSNLSWGVVDDTCDGIVQAMVVVGGVRHVAQARVCIGPPDFAPDRRPFFSLADDLTDRDIPFDATADGDPRQIATPDGPSAPVPQEAIADLFARVFETVSLLNLDAIRARGLSDNQGFLLADPTQRVGDLPLTDQGSMTSAENTVDGRPGKQYASAKVVDLIGDGRSVARGGQNPLAYTDLVALAHAPLAELEALTDLLRTFGPRVGYLVRPPYARFRELGEQPAETPDPRFRDPRIRRDTAHDMRMPPYMRDSDATALSLTHRQYAELMSYVEALQSLQPLVTKRVTGEAEPPDDGVRGPQAAPAADAAPV
ncbi:MAG TPA: hypothetical protein VL242_11625, partial [Sorangium sp.]|nr:hypothetical protein [Sorangium sp.]